MRLVKISDLSEKERKKAFEEQQKRLEENRRISEQNRINANNQFNELINKTGAFDTNNHTTNFYNITNAMKSSGASKQSISGFKKSNHISLWDSVLDVMNGTGKVVENTWLGLNNGIKSFQQTIGKRISENQERQMKTFNEWNKKNAEEIMQENPIKGKALLEQKPLISEEEIKSENNENIKKIQNKKQINEEKINKNIEEIKNPAMKKIAEISPSIGQMIPAFASGGIGAVYMAGSSTGQYYDDAKQRGMSDEEAKTYSGIMGLMEGTTEMIGINSLSKAGKGLKEFVKGAGKEVVKETAEEVSKSTLKKVLKDYGVGIADNMIQEALIDPIQEFTAQTVAGKDKAQWEGLNDRMLQDAINGGLVSAILGGANLGIQSCTGLVQKYNSNQEITSEEFKKAAKDASKKLDTGEMIKQNVQQEVKKYNLQNENVQNNIVDTKGMTFEESASANNIDINNNTIKTVSQALSNRNIAGRFDSSYFKNSNENAIWRTYTDEQGNTKREVIFNPNGDSQNTMQQISIHELTHDLVGTKEYEELKNLVLDKNKTRQGYKEARQSLESTYSQVYDSNSENFKSLVDDEEVADTLAQKLGDQDFINSLNVEKPNVFKRIYNWVVDKVNKITGDKFEKVYWEDIKNKFENAYIQTYQGENNTQSKYSVGGLEGIKNIVNSKKKIDKFENYKIAKKMIKEGKKNEEVFSKTGWFQDKVTGEMKFNFSDKDMDVISKNYEIGKEYALKEILKHNTLFEMYPQLKEYKVIIEDMNTNKNKKTIRGAYNRYTDTIKLDYRRFNKKSDVEGTLIHEIQHAIQKIENFSGGASKVWGKKFYQKSPGEIEARDTSNRLIEEKYNSKDLNNIMPKSGKLEVSILDKMKIGLYNYLKNKKGGVNADEDISKNKEKNPQDNRENNRLVLGRINKERDGEIQQDEKIKGNGNSNEINQESMEQTDREALQNSYRQVWNGLKDNRQLSYYTKRR